MPNPTIPAHSEQRTSETVAGADIHPIRFLQLNNQRQDQMRRILLVASLLATAPAHAQFYGQGSAPYGQSYGQVYGRSYGQPVYGGTVVVVPTPGISHGYGGQTILQDNEGGSCVIPAGASSCQPYR